MSALVRVAFGPSFHVTGSACERGLRAPPRVGDDRDGRDRSTLTARLTPGSLRIAVSSKLASLPPNTGHWLIAAQSMPCIFTSMAYTRLPSSFGAVSSRFIGLPATFHVRGSFSVIDFGSGGVDLRRRRGDLAVRRRAAAGGVRDDAVAAR